MITGVHTMFYTSQADALREFLRDKLELHATDVGQGWLIFDLPEAEMGCHPADGEKGAISGTHDISFYCDDINKTVEQLKAKGVEFTDGVADHGYGLVTRFKVPGDFSVQLFQPRYVKKPAKSKAKPATKKSMKRTVKKEVKKAMKKAVKKSRFR